MADTYVECLVQRKSPAYAFLVKAIVWILIVLSFLIAMTSFFVIITVTILLGVAAAFLFPTFNVEYEYVFLGDELHVDVIYNKSKRKNKGKYLMSRVDIVAMKNSAEIRPFLQKPGASKNTVDFTTKTGDGAVYAMVYSDGNKQEIILFEPSEKLLDAMRYAAPRKVVIGC